MVGEADQPSWHVGHGLIALTPEESAELRFHEMRFDDDLASLPEEQALLLAAQMEGVTPRVAWIGRSWPATTDAGTT